jgi:hypothetical protein
MSMDSSWPRCNWSGNKERTLSLMGESKQILVPCLKYTSSGCWCLCTQPINSEPGVTAPLMGSLPHSMESIFEVTLGASLLDEFTHDIKGFGIACFEPFGIMKNKEPVFG